MNLNGDINNLMNEPYLFPSTDEVITLSKRIEQLNIDVNTQNLKIEVEKLKRQKLGSTLRQMKK